jgi:hypothetical protein
MVCGLLSSSRQQLKGEKSSQIIKSISKEFLIVAVLFLFSRNSKKPI